MRRQQEPAARFVPVQRLPFVSLVLVVALLAACGSKSSQPSSTADWANGVCTAISTWESSLISAADSLKGGNLSKNSLQSAVDDMTSATDTLQSDLKGLGKPDTQAGQQAKDSIDQLSTELKTGADSIKTAANGASDLSSTIAAAPTITAALKTMANQISSTYTSLKQLDAKGDLQAAFQQSSACKQLSASH